MKVKLNFLYVYGDFSGAVVIVSENRAVLSYGTLISVGGPAPIRSVSESRARNTFLPRKFVFLHEMQW